MKKSILSFLLVFVMVLSLLPAVALTAKAEKADTIIGVSFDAEGLYDPGSGYYPENYTMQLIMASGETIEYSCGVGPLRSDEKQNTPLEEYPELDETYYFSLWIWGSGLEQNITNANSAIQFDGFYNGKVLSAQTEDDGDIKIVCSVTCGELTAGVWAKASGVEYDSEFGAYAPQFIELNCRSARGDDLEPVRIPTGNGDYYSYYGAASDCLYKTYSNENFSGKLTTEPQIGETYYSCLKLDSIDGGLHIKEALTYILIPGYDVKFIEAYESDMGFTSVIVYSVTRQYDVYIAGVGLTDGDYLAVGATAATRTKPSGGYAYYEDGILTLNNYSYSGPGVGINPPGISETYEMIVYVPNTVTLNLEGTNTLIDTESQAYCIWAAYGLTVEGTGSLMIEGAEDGIVVCAGNLTVNSGKIIARNVDFGFDCWNRSIIINGGDIDISSYYSSVLANINITINGGTINTTGTRGLLAYRSVRIYGGRVSVTGTYRAIEYHSSFDVAEGLNILSSTTVDGALGAYAAENHASYKKILVSDQPINPFTDVPEDSFYYIPVLWAVENGITTGATATTFNPNGNCLRAHVVTFLHRAAGNPEPTATAHPFQDVNEKAYYYKAMLWAVENGITTGMTADTFAPDSFCTRGQVVTFLWRAAGKPEPSSTSHPFQDVSANAYYYKAMLWAVEKGITSGMTATTFAPDNTCTRGQAVTFLYRAYN